MKNFNADINHSIKTSLLLTIGESSLFKVRHQTRKDTQMQLVTFRDMHWTLQDEILERHPW